MVHRSMPFRIVVDDCYFLKKLKKKKKKKKTTIIVITYNYTFRLPFHCIKQRQL